MLRLSAGLLFLLLAAPFAHAADDPERAALIDELIAGSGIDAVIDELPANLAAQFEALPPNVYDDDVDRYAKAMLAAADLDRFREAVKALLEANYDPKRYKAIRDVLATPFARKMLAVELAANRPEAQAGLEQFLTNPPANLSVKRLALIHKIDKGAHVTESMWILASDVAVGIAISKADTLPEDFHLELTDLREARNQTRGVMWDGLAELTEVSLAYMYRDVPDEELAQYVAMYESKPMRWFAELQHAAWVYFVDRTTVDAAKVLYTLKKHDRGRCRPPAEQATTC